MFNGNHMQAVMLLPATLLGATIGVFLNKLCPNWLIMFLLVLLCAISGKRTLEQVRYCLTVKYAG